MKADVLKKHHFWILAGVVPLFVLIAVILMMTSVSGAISARSDEVGKAIKDATSTQPPGAGMIRVTKENEAKIGSKKEVLWKANWDLQEKFFAWPKPPGGNFDKYAKLKFGNELKQTTNEFQIFTADGVYMESYREFPAKIAPTTFRGGWQSVLRYVNSWGVQTPVSEQIWLSLEDLWVQRGMVDPIDQVNDSIAAFTEVPDQQSTKFKKKFRSRVWDLSLELADIDFDGKKYQTFRGKLKNRTSQLQLLGVGNTMRLNVWLDKRTVAQPVEFRIEGEFVAGDFEIDIPPLVTNFLIPGTNPVELARVEQILDARTVPIRRLDQLVLGFRSDRNATAELKAPEFWKDEPVATTPAGDGGNPLGGLDGAPAMGPGMGVGGGRGLGGSGGAAAGAGVGPQAGGPATVLNANKRRYLEVTGQLRRMPVALVVIVDQAYIEDVLVAYANSPFRFQAVQMHWKRFRDSLGNTAPSGGSSGSGAGEDLGGIGGDAGGSFGQRGGFGMQPGPGMGMGMGPGMGMGSGMGMGFGGSSQGSVSEAQANSGLVELSLYGIISLYERLPEETKPADGATAETKPADTGKTPPAVDDKTTTPPAPMGDGKTPPAGDKTTTPPAGDGKTTPPAPPGDGKTTTPPPPGDGKTATPPPAGDGKANPTPPPASGTGKQ